MAVKARYWSAICYPENMIDSWVDDIGDILQVPYAYCVHDKDTLDDDLSKRKIHVHILLAFNNTTTQKHAMEVVLSLSKVGCKCASTIEQVFNIRHMYNYLIHDTETCKKKGKHLYNDYERETGNLFDIGAFEQFSVAEKEAIIEEIENVIFDKHFTNFADLFYYLKTKSDHSYLIVLRGNSGYFERILKGYYHKLEEERKTMSVAKFKGRKLNKSAAK